MRLFSALIEWHSASEDVMLPGGLTVEQQEKVFQRLIGKFLPAPVKDVFKRKNALCSDTTAFQLRQTPNCMEASIDALQELYDLPGLRYDLQRYFLGSRARHDMNLPFRSLSTWERMRIQLRDPQDPELVMPPLTVEATPRNASHVGRYNFVLLHRPENTSSNSFTDVDGLPVDDFGIKGKFLASA